MANYIKGKRVQTSNKGWLTTQGLTETITPLERLFFNKNVSGNLFSAKVCVLCPGMTPVLFTSGFLSYRRLVLTTSKPGSHLHNTINANSGHWRNKPEDPWERKPCLLSDAFQTPFHCILAWFSTENWNPEQGPTVTHQGEVCMEEKCWVKGNNVFSYQQRL